MESDKGKKIEYLVKAESIKEVGQKVLLKTNKKIESIRNISHFNLEREYWRVNFESGRLPEFRSKKNEDIGDIYILKTLSHIKMVKKYCDRGLKKYLSHDFKGAIKAYDIAFDHGYYSSDVYFGRGKAKYKLHDWDGTYYDFCNAIKSNPDNAEYYVERGKLIIERFGEDTYAIADFNKAIEIDSLNIEAYNNLAIAIHEVDYTGAIQALSKAIEIDPHNVETYYYVGRVKDCHKDYLGAIEAYRKAIEIDPQNSETYFNLGNLKRDHEDYSGANHAFNIAIELAPAVAGVYYELGNVKEIQRDYQGAIHAFNKEIEINPKNHLAYYHLGLSKEDIKDHLGAIQAFNKASELDPSEEDVYFSLGKVQYAIQYLQGVIQTFSKAIEYKSKKIGDTSYFDFFIIRGLTKYFINDRIGEIEDYNKAIKLAPKLAQKELNFIMHQNQDAMNIYDKTTMAEFSEEIYFYKRGRLKTYLNDFLGAINDFSKVIEINPKNVDALLLCGKLKFDLKNYDGAVLDYTKVIELKPQLSDAYLIRGIAKKNQTLTDKSFASNFCVTMDDGHYVNLDAGISDWEIAASLGNKEAIRYLEEFEDFKIEWSQQL